MNYYEHHLGDYMRDTAHLSMLEDGAYRRLIDAYYIAEQPFPDDKREVMKIARATTKAERDAVEYVLRKFFVYEAGSGWLHKRCSIEIARFQDKQRKAKASAEARWSQSERNANASPNASANAMRTHSERNADGMHRAPVPSPQSPEKRKDKGRASDPPRLNAREAEGNPGPEAAPPEVNGHDPTRAGLACRAMRKAGLQATNPGDPRLIALCEQGATDEEFAGLAAEAVEKSKGFAWVLVALQARRAEAAAIALAPPPAEDPDAWLRTRSGVINRACQLGLGPWDEVAAHVGTGPNWGAYRQSVIEAAARQGATA